ncbi:MAG: hypothetical protein ABI970_16045 [Chloroflexota bacterium]
MSSQMDYKGIKERVEVRVRKEKRLSNFILLATNLGLYVMFLVIAWQMYLANGGTLPNWDSMVNLPGFVRSAGDPTTSALMMLSIGWAVAILLQTVGFIIDSPIGERSIRDRAMGREMRKEMTRLGMDELEEQEKRKGMMRLTDDGELEAVDDVSEVDVTPIKQNRKA